MECLNKLPECHGQQFPNTWCIRKLLELKWGKDYNGTRLPTRGSPHGAGKRQRDAVSRPPLGRHWIGGTSAAMPPGAIPAAPLRALWQCCLLHFACALQPSYRTGGDRRTSTRRKCAGGGASVPEQVAGRLLGPARSHAAANAALLGGVLRSPLSLGICHKLSFHRSPTP